MPDAGRDHHRVPRFDVHDRSARAAELHVRVAARQTQHLVGRGVVVVEVVDAVDPGVAPGIASEMRFDCGLHASQPMRIESATINNQRHVRIVRHEPVVGQPVVLDGQRW